MSDETTIIEHAIMERLDHVIDPELGRSVTQLGMIANVTVIPTSGGASQNATGGISSPMLTGGTPRTGDATRNDSDAAASNDDAADRDATRNDFDDATGSDAGDATGSDAGDGRDGARRAYDVVVDVELTVPGCPLSEQIAAQIEQAVTSYPYARLTPHINVGTMADEKLHALVNDLKAARRENPFNKPGIKTRVFAIASGKGGVGKSSISANLAATFAALGYDTAAIDADIYGF